MAVDIVDVKKRFADWVSELSEVDNVGCALVDKQIVPLFTNKGATCLIVLDTHKQQT